MEQQKIATRPKEQRLCTQATQGSPATYGTRTVPEIVCAAIFLLHVPQRLVHAQLAPHAQPYEVQRGGTVDRQSLRFVPFLRQPAKEQTMQELVTAVESGAYTGLNPNSQAGEQFMASAWAGLHNGNGLPLFGNSSQAHIFSTNLLMVVQEINAATWDRVSSNPPHFGAAIKDYKQAPMFAHHMRNLVDPYTLQFCSNRFKQCKALLEPWVRDIGEASVRGAKRLQSDRLAQWQSEQQTLADLQRQRQAQQHAEQRAKEQAQNDAFNADVATQAARIRARQNRTASE